MLFLPVLICLSSFRLWKTTGCKQFTSFYFNPISVKISVESQRTLDNQSFLAVSRIFHNKLNTTPFELTKAIAQALTPRFLIEILGPLGFMLTILAVLRIIKEKHKRALLHLLLVISASILAVLPGNPKNFFLIISLTWFSVTFWGLQFFSNTNKLLLYFFLILLTFWYFNLSWQMPAICNEIFFN